MIELTSQPLIIPAHPILLLTVSVFIYTSVQNIFCTFLKEDSYTHQSCIYLIKNAVKTVTLCNIITILNNYFNVVISCAA